MRYLAIILGLLVLFAAGACRQPGPGIDDNSSILTVAVPTSTTAVTPSPTNHTSLKPTAPSPATPAPPLIEIASPSTGSDSLADQIVRVISPENANKLSPISEHFFGPWTQVLSIAWSPAGESLAVAAGEAIYILEATSLRVQHVLELGVATPGLDFSPDGLRLAAGDRNGVLTIWDATEAQPLLELQAHQKSISNLVFSPDGRLLATAGYDALARLWDAGSWASLGEMIGGSYAIPAIAFTQDGTSLAIVNGNVIRLRDVETSRFVRTLIGDASFYTIATAPGGQYLASGDVENTVRIWDLNAEAGPGGEIRDSLFTLSGHTGRANRPEALIWEVNYSPDGSMLASAGGDGKVCLWESATGELLVSLDDHFQAVTSAVFSPDGRWLVSGGLDGRLVSWAVMPSEAELTPEQDQNIP